MKFEIAVIPVSDVDRAKEFYQRIGWRLDADYAAPGGDFRVIQFTPPGSGASVSSARSHRGGPRLCPGPLPDRLRIEAARQELINAASRSARCSMASRDYIGPDEPYLFGRVRVSGPDPEHSSYRSFASFNDPDGNGWLFRRSPRGNPDVSIPTQRPCFAGRPGACISARGGCPRRAREAGRRRPSVRPGLTGTPRTWWRNKPAPRCRNKLAAMSRSPGRIPGDRSINDLGPGSGLQT